MSFHSVAEDVQNICCPEINRGAQSTIVEPDLQNSLSLFGGSSEWHGTAARCGFKQIARKT